jgi:hypothetical protein
MPSSPVLNTEVTLLVNGTPRIAYRFRRRGPGDPGVAQLQARSRRAEESRPSCSSRRQRRAADAVDPAVEPGRGR